ncbi:hypothetical protein BKA64DRAFT_710910 [Cadophora sp. MPI-SDFR-AT-0126]|nr:hypothetical protein BKA64DRAFT_710910 [Leotiomycetes sp. MPI-SDFR-AT-0126]
MSSYFRSSKNQVNNTHSDHESDEQNTNSTQRYQDRNEISLGTNSGEGFSKQEETLPAKRPRPTLASSSTRIRSDPQIQYRSTSTLSASTITPTSAPDQTQIVYTRSAEGRWLCTRPPCKNTFADKNSVKRHVHTVHDGARDYECEICHHTFSDARRRIGHLKNTNPRYKECNNAWKAGRVPGAPGYIAPVLAPSVTPTTSPLSVGYCSSSDSTAAANRNSSIGDRDEDCSYEVGRYMFDPLASEEQQKSYTSQLWEPVSSQGFNPEVSLSIEDEIYPATFLSSTTSQQQGHLGEVSGSSSRTDYSFPPDGTTASSQHSRQVGNPYTGPMLTPSQPGGQAWYSNVIHVGRPYAGQAERPARSSSFLPQLPDAALKPNASSFMAPPRYPQHHHRRNFQEPHDKQYRPAASAQENKHSSPIGSHRLRDAMFQQQDDDQHSSPMIPQPSGYSYNSRYPVPRYQGAVPGQYQNISYSRASNAQLNQNDYASSSQYPQRQSHFQGQRYNCPPPAAFPPTFESMSYSHPSTASYDQPSDTQPVLGKRKERDPDENQYDFNSFPRSTQQTLVIPTPTSDSYSELDVASPRVDNSLFTPSPTCDESLGSDPADKSEADEPAPTHQSGADDAGSGAVSTVHHPSVHIPQVIWVNRHGRYRAKKSTILESSKEGWVKSLGEDDPLEAWHKIVFGGK